ncbi:HNH endonuclease [Corynebacterium camporealensis]|nr:HNH endonuclease [Corynebacterium camporealensis]
METLSEVAALTNAHLQMLGFPRKFSRELLTLSDIYFGETPYTQLQAKSRNTPHDLSTLLEMEKKASRIKKHVDRYKFRIACADVPASKIGQVAKEFMDPPKPPEEGTALTRSKTDRWTYRLTGDSELIAQVRDMFPTIDSVREFLRTGKVNGTAVTTHVVINLDELDKIVDGQGDDIVLQMTNGAKITGAQLVQQMFTDHGYATLIHPVEARSTSIARNEAQVSSKEPWRRPENPVCPWIHCLKGADECQVHHIVAWKYGGETNASNLTTACDHHNGRNDDGNERRNGKLLRIRGKVEWVPPWAY